MFEINQNIHGLKLSWTDKSPRFKMGCLILNEPINIDTAFKTGSDYLPRLNNLLGYFFWKDTFIAYQYMYIQLGINYLHGKRLLHNLYSMIRTLLWENTFLD